METQQAFNLRAVGYDEPRPSSASYPFLPVPEIDRVAALNFALEARRESDVQWLRSMTTRYGHCGQ